MPHSLAIANAFGTLGTVCWTGQLLPQLWKSYREKDTTGLSAFLPFVWGISAAPLGAYSIVRKLAMPLVVQPQLFAVFCLASWAQCMHYGRGHGRWACVGMLLGLLAVLGGVEAGLVFAARYAWEKGNTAPTTFLGVLSSVLIALALVPQYVEIYRLGHVRGISLPFMAIDAAGGVFNDLALVWAGFDALACTTYTLVIVMDLAVVVAAVVLNPRARRRMVAAAAADAEAGAPPAPEKSIELDSVPPAPRA